jgi:hypothetical protein
MFFFFIFYKIREQEGGSVPAWGEEIGRGRWWGNEIGA